MKVDEVIPNWFVHWLHISDVAEIDDDLQAWLRESYRLMGMQERLRANPSEKKRRRGSGSVLRAYSVAA